MEYIVCEDTDNGMKNQGHTLNHTLTKKASGKLPRLKL